MKSLGNKQEKPANIDDSRILHLPVQARSQHVRSTFKRGVAITVAKRIVRGREWWVIDRNDPETGKRKRSFFKTESSANAEASSLRAGASSNARRWSKLRTAEKESAIAAVLEAQDCGHSLHGLMDIARKVPGSPAGPTLTKVIDELAQAKTRSGRNKSYVTNLKAVLTGFASGRGSMPISRMTVHHVEAFLDSKTLASRSAYRSRLSTLFKFSIRRGYRSDNPCARLEPVRYVKPPPSTFTPAQFSKAWKWLAKNAPQGLAWFALSAACGLRPEEAEKTTKRDIHFGEGFVRVESQTTKVRQRRVVYPRPEAMALVKRSLKLGGRLPFGPESRRRCLKRLRVALGFKAWPKDITRHTAASYWLASGESAAVVSHALGNSEKVLKRDYMALKTRAEADKFWKALESI